MPVFERESFNNSIPVEFQILMQFRSPVVVNFVLPDHLIPVRVQVIMEGDDAVTRIERNPTLPVVNEPVPVKVEVGLELHPPVFQ